MTDDQCEIRENGRRCKRPLYVEYKGHAICFEHWNQDGKNGFDIVKELKL